MKPISRPAHGVIDYVMSATLVALPHVIKMSPSASRLFTGVGMAHVTYSLLTRYEMGAVKKLPFKKHLALDAAWAIAFLAAGAAMASENKAVRATLAGIGASELGAVLLTDTQRPRATVL